MRMKTTTTPMTIRIAGSMKASAAVSAVATSSSKNSATELSICGQRAGLFADGNHFRGQFGEDFRVLQGMRPGSCLRARVPMDENTALEMRCEEMERAAVSSEGTSGRPPVSRVESVREKSATWYLSQILPKMGSRCGCRRCGPRRCR